MMIAARADPVGSSSAREATRARDAGLVARAGRGDERAFAELYDAHRPRLQRLAYGILLDVEEAREAVQEAFLRLHLAAPTWEPRAAIETWLYRVVVNHCLSLRRRLLRLAPWRGDRVSPGASPESQAAAGEAVRVVVRSLRALPMRGRAIACLALEAELTPAEIAEVVKLTPNATRVALHRALAQVRADLRAAGIDAPPTHDESSPSSEDLPDADAP
jgi:RNA polymerase sigma-70 factor (ECF subfamily)